MVTTHFTSTQQTAINETSSSDAIAVADYIDEGAAWFDITPSCPTLVALTNKPRSPKHTEGRTPRR